jgi:hypothetical protein
MRMKEDHMKNGQLKPGYNVQTGTEGQFIIGYSLHQRAGDTQCLIEHLEHVKQYIPLPQNIIGDSGYGSEENYTYLEEQGKKAYIPYHTLDQEQKRTWKKRIERVENMEYEEEADEFVCANGQRFTFRYETKKESSHGYLSIKRRYRCDQCQGCPFQSTCAKGKTHRTITISLKNQIQRKEIKERLLSEEGKEKYRRRKTEVESVYGQIKQNQDFRRFHLRGLSKTTVEWGLVCVAHNFKKWQKIRELQQGGKR